MRPIDDATYRVDLPEGSLHEVEDLPRLGFLIGSALLVVVVLFAQGQGDESNERDAETVAGMLDLSIDERKFVAEFAAEATTAYSSGIVDLPSAWVIGGRYVVDNEAKFKEDLDYCFEVQQAYAKAPDSDKRKLSRYYAYWKERMERIVLAPEVFADLEAEIQRVLASKGLHITIREPLRPWGERSWEAFRSSLLEVPRSLNPSGFAAAPVVVYRDGGRTLRFTGSLLGAATSRDSASLRWNEVNVYRTSRGNYIASSIGRTVVPGEVDRCNAHSAANPREIVDFLMQRGFLTVVAREALQTAASIDPAIADALIEDV